MLLADLAPIQSTAPGTTVTIPQEMLAKRYEGGTVWEPLGGFVAEIRTDGGLDMILAPPAEVGRLRNTQVHLKVGISAASYRMTIMGLPPAGQPVMLASYDHPTATKELRIADADKFTTAAML